MKFKFRKGKKLKQRFLQNSMQLSAFGGPQFQNSMEICHNVDFQLCKKKLWPRLVFIYWCFDSLTLRSVFPVKCWEYCNKAQCCIKSEAQTGECGRLNSGWVTISISDGFFVSFKGLLLVLKVRKFQKKIVMSPILSKNQREEN